MRYIIDGYNVINAWEDLERLGKEGLHFARKRLIRMMEEYRVLSGNEVIVVFDGAKIEGLPHKEGKINGVTVLFSRPPLSADGLIERLVYKTKDPSSIAVVTSDQFLKNFVLGKGAISYHPDLFRKEVTSLLDRMRDEYTA